MITPLLKGAQSHPLMSHGSQSGGIPEVFEKLMQRLLPEKAQRALQPFTMTLKDYWENALPVANKTPINTQRQQSAYQHQVTSASDSTVDKAIYQASQDYKIPEKLIRSVIKAESNFNPHALSPAGAQGLMQLMPGTARELGVKNPFDVQENIQGGVRYLRKMLDSFGQDVKKALAAYNAGPGTVKKYGGIPPYKETKQYVSRILKDYNYGA